MLRIYFLCMFFIAHVNCYGKQLHYFSNLSKNEFELICDNEVRFRTNNASLLGEDESIYFKTHGKGKLSDAIILPIDTKKKKLKNKYGQKVKLMDMKKYTPTSIKFVEEDPYEVFQKILHRFIFGSSVDSADNSPSVDEPTTPPTTQTGDFLAHYPVGNYMRGELFNNRSAVHLIHSGFIHRGHARLLMTEDYLQNAVDTFSILLEGNLDDIYELPSRYVLKSARAISMMKLPLEKLSALWTVVKHHRKPHEMPIEDLEMYRPLFKYVNAREIARLNLKNDRILSYIGTHAELDRHQMGVVASKYMQVNRNWSQPQYLNLMNNLLCGMPMTFMRRIRSDIYLQLTHEVFYHIHACDPLQRRFYLTQMTKTEALGKSYSWSARDVSRLGLLLGQVEGPELAAINPEAVAGITSRVILEIPARNLPYFTPVQLRHLALKPLNIYARRLKAYQDSLGLTYNRSTYVKSHLFMYLLFILIYSVVLK